MPLLSEALLRAPVAYSGSLDEHEHFDVTGPIGREFPKLQLSELLKDERQIRDLAVLGNTPISVEYRLC